MIVLRFVLLGVLTIFSSFAMALDKLHIKAGKPFIIDRSLSQLKLESLVIDDKAVIKIARGVKLWAVDANDVSIGFGVVVQGAGAAGATGASGGSVPDASSCDIARAGKSGGRGASGSDGVDIRWSVGVTQLGSIQFDLSGGNGGNGGAGGDGQNLPNIAGCRASGGNAGNGGYGGDGGDGGSMRFHYRMNSDDGSDLSNSVYVKTKGGVAGQGGGPGFPGVGSEGRFEQKKSLTGNRSWVAGGGDGKEGSTGRSGSRGSNGGLDIRRIYKEGEAPPVVVEIEASEEASLSPGQKAGFEARIEELEVLTQKLEARLKLLELDKR